MNITSREVMTALQSDLIPDVHPLREYILSLPPFTPDQPDWIDWLAQQVHVRESASSGVQELLLNMRKALLNLLNL